MLQPNIGLGPKKLKRLSQILSVVLSDEVTLYTKTRKFHWNVGGPSFMEIHRLFEEHYTELEKIIDEVAELISKLGQPTIGTMREFSALTHLKEDPGVYPTRKEMIGELLSDHETVIIYLRKYIDKCTERLADAGTADFLTGLMQQHETMAWTLRRYLN
jgi:starvation-inducible DNA-binding protein